MLERTVVFNARQCPFRTNVNRTFCPAQPKLMGHLEKLIGLAMSDVRRLAPSLVHNNHQGDVLFMSE